MSTVERKRPPSNSSASPAHSAASRTGGVTAWPTVSRRSVNAAQSRVSMLITPLQRAAAALCERRRRTALRRREARVGLLVLRAHARAVADRRRLDRVARAALLLARADRQHEARPDDRMRHARRAVHEVPGAQRALLALDDQQRRAPQHEEVLL